MEWPMYVIHAPISTFISILARSSEFPFPAVIIPLVRSTDANWHEVTAEEYWRSLHDVTARTLFVACPSDDLERTELIAGRTSDADLSTAGVQFQAYPDIEKLTWTDVQIGEMRRTAPTRADRSSIGWNDSASALSAFFGLQESRLPCVVFLDVVNQFISALAVPSTTSIYQIAKLLMQELGSGPQELDRTTREYHTARDHECDASAKLIAADRRKDLVAQYHSTAVHLRALHTGDAQLYSDCASLLERSLDNHELLPTLQKRLKDTKAGLLATSKGTGVARKKVDRILDNLARRGSDLLIPGNPGYEALRRELGAAHEATTAAHSSRLRARNEIDVTRAVGLIGRMMFDNAVRTSISATTERHVGWRGAWIGPKDATIHHAILEQAPKRRRVKRVAIASGATALVTAGAAVFINFATAEGSSYWEWALAATLTASAGISYFSSS
jgi:hypothetical protein